MCGCALGLADCEERPLGALTVSKSIGDLEHVLER
jgi:hypothetical protein